MSGIEPTEGRACNTLRDQPGPLEDEQCDHRGQLPQDPPPAFTQSCTETAAFGVPNPNGYGQCVALCSWHLARYLDAFPDTASSLRDRLDDLDEHLPDQAWTSLDQLPPTTDVVGDDDRWPLFAFDQRGHAYYADCIENPSQVAVYAPGEWELYDEWVNVPAGANTRDVADNIADAHGLAALSTDVVEHCRSSGGGSR